MRLADPLNISCYNCAFSWGSDAMRLFRGIIPVFVAALLAPAHPGLAQKAALTPDGPLTESERQAFDAMAPAATKATKLPPVPGASAMRPRLSNVAAALGLPFAGRLKEGYEAFMKGDTDRALALVDSGIEDAWGSQMKFRLSLIKADLLTRTDRIADAEIAVLDTARRERDYWGKTLIARAVRGDIRARLGDAAQSAGEGDLARVALSQKSWQLPLEFDEMPDMTSIVMNTEAKYRSALGLASFYIRNGQYAAGLAWAVRLEGHFTRLFTLADNPEYGDMVPLIPEFYIARAENMAYLGAGILSVHDDPQRAAPYFAAADGFYEAMNYTYGRAYTAALRARALYDIGRFEDFEAAAEPAVALAAAAGLGELVWRLEALRGERFFAAGRLDLAEASLRRAQAAVNLVSGALASDQSKLRFGLGKEGLTHLLAAVDLAKGSHAALFSDMEQGRARAFVDMLATQTVASGTEADLMAKIRRLERDIRRLRLANTLPGAASGAGLAQVEDLLAQHSEVTAELRRRNPELADTLSIAATTLDDTQARLKPGEVLAYAVPATAKSTIAWLLIRSGDIRVVNTAITQKLLNRKLAVFAEMVSGGDGDLQREIVKVLAKDLRLDQWGADSGAYVVPTGSLHLVPWGAMNVDHFIAVLPTGAWLSRPPGTSPANQAGVVGDPAFAGAEPQLPGARAEAEKIAATYGVTPMLGKAATEAALRRAVGAGVGILHLATHGQFDASAPLNSAVLLAGPGGVQRLTAARLFEAPLRADLVVLSACETGVGQAVAGDDYLGLTRSFYLGGARTVINSLWPVEDKGTQAFMTRFHELAKTGDYGAAWLGARDAVKQQGFPPSVYGAFVLGGAPQR